MSIATPSSTPKPALAVRWVPALAWLRSYQRPWLRSDVVAGLTAAAVVVPQAMAYGAIAGLPLVVEGSPFHSSIVPAPPPASITKVTYPVLRFPPAPHHHFEKH